MKLRVTKFNYRWVVGVFFVGLLLSFLANAYHFLQSPLSAAPARLDYVVEPGASVRAIADDLHALGVLKYPRYWALYARFTELATRIHSGEYQLDTRWTPIELLDQFSKGKVKQHSFVIVEGWTFKQLLQALRRDPILQQQAPDSVQATVDMLGSELSQPEGWFLPDTYHFPAGTTALEFLQRAHRAMQTKLEQAWQQRDEGLPLSNAYEALILASIVERETAVAEERTKIAGVFIQRLRLGMRLQTDPTVIYGMGDAFQGNIRSRDLRHDTPYNTYTRKGLPPTPIAMPGADAIYAVMHPQVDGYLYFVARGDGTHQFSKTLEEHNAAVSRYQLSGQKQATSVVP